MGGAKGHLDIYIIICGPNKTINLKISLLYYYCHMLLATLAHFFAMVAFSLPPLVLHCLLMPCTCPTACSYVPDSFLCLLLAYRTAHQRDWGSWPQHAPFKWVSSPEVKPTLPVLWPKDLLAHLPLWAGSCIWTDRCQAQWAGCSPPLIYIVTFTETHFQSLLLSASTMVSSAYLKLLIFVPSIFTPPSSGFPYRFCIQIEQTRG